MDKNKKCIYYTVFLYDCNVVIQGETANDFDDTMNLIHQVQFDESYSSIYSPRPNTTASVMYYDVTKEEK